jgi:hypothetical protein
MTRVENRVRDAAAQTLEGVPPPPASSKGAKDNLLPFSSLDGSTITLHPSGLKFDVPANWARHHAERNNLHLSRGQLEKVEKPDFDEWDREFAPACNAALPFDRCAAHVGSEGWGDDGRRYDDLQVRAYDLPRTTSQFEDRIAHDASAAVKTNQVRRETNRNWRRILVSYGRKHFDYGATAHIDIILTNVGDRTLAFVFMYTDALKESDSIPMILKSVRRGS